MIRRRQVLALPAVLAGCGLAERPYVERRSWSLEVTRPKQLPPRTGGAVLLVRGFRAGPGLDARGLQSLQPDGSVAHSFYEEWAVPPAQAVEDGLRRWLADAGLFAAVLAPGSRLAPDLTLEGELDALATDPARNRAAAAIAITVLAQRAETVRLLVQRSFSAESALATADAPAQVQAVRAAVAAVFAQIEAALAGVP